MGYVLVSFFFRYRRSIGIIRLIFMIILGFGREFWLDNEEHDSMPCLTTAIKF